MTKIINQSLTTKMTKMLLLKSFLSRLPAIITFDLNIHFRNKRVLGRLILAFIKKTPELNV